MSDASGKLLFFSANAGSFTGAPASTHARNCARSAVVGNSGTRITPSLGAHGGIAADSSACNAVSATRFTSAAVVNRYAPAPPTRWHDKQHRSTLGAMSRSKSGVSAGASASASARARVAQLSTHAASVRRTMSVARAPRGEQSCEV